MDLAPDPLEELTSPQSHVVHFGSSPERKLRLKVIMMVSDFFYPDAGGVEMNIWATSQCLRAKGHKVIVVTATKGNRIGVRYMSNIKVYYLPQQRWIQNVVVPSGMLVPMLRNIMLRERVQIIHVHQCTTPIGLEAFYTARLLGIYAIYHDHSLFAISDPVAFHLNKLLNVVIRSAVSRVIAVSHTNKENLLIRAGVPMNKVYVIPNAIDATQFRPNPAAQDKGVVTIVIVIRMTYRKGVDILLDLIPDTCHQFKDVRFLLGGDGPKFCELVSMVQREKIQDQVELMGRVHPSQVGKLLNRGVIYLNPSLTEAFGISLVEAASAGLYVVSTNVGGVPEVLPQEFMTMANPNSEDLKAALWETIYRHHMGSLPDPMTISKYCSHLFDWADVANRTEKVYDDAMEQRVERNFSVIITQDWQGFRMISVMTVVIWIWFYFIVCVADYVYPQSEMDQALPYRLVKPRQTKRNTTGATFVSYPLRERQITAESGTGRKVDIGSLRTDFMPVPSERVRRRATKDSVESTDGADTIDEPMTREISL